MLKKLFSDYRGLCGACGVWPATRWLAAGVLRAKQCVRGRNLAPADVAMGDGPFRVRSGASGASVAGGVCFGGIREIWVRDVYRGHGFLTLPQSGVVVDLGANLGMFSLLAAAQGPGVSVVSVEPNRGAVAVIEESFRRNGWSERLRVCNFFVGTESPMMAGLLGTDEYRGVPFVSEREFIERVGLTRIDFLKCDIEGSEWGLLTAESELLRMANQVGVEVHGDVSRQGEFVRMLDGQGFQTRVESQTDADCIVQAKRPVAAAAKVGAAT